MKTTARKITCFPFSTPTASNLNYADKNVNSISRKNNTGSTTVNVAYAAADVFEVQQKCQAALKKLCLRTEV